ncbi:hypothetical protein JTE90_013607 [Oedothorax gibbosus]|uniref:Uncharacterized protein n=1 Tax=Oedothorax gibbosus TaxID=931172 RepID=A0AAV6VEA1_9ARAC|nr:hypothetical protein JTE90_013607 [Oedothorax gibbosus]
MERNLSFRGVKLLLRNSSNPTTELPAMSLHPIFLFSLTVMVWLWSTTEASRFSRNEARCAVVCMNKGSEECRMCNTRIPMRFGKRNYRAMPAPAGYLYDLDKMEKPQQPDVRFLALVEGVDGADLDSDEI